MAFFISHYRVIQSLLLQQHQILPDILEPFPFDPFISLSHQY